MSSELGGVSLDMSILGVWASAMERPRIESTSFALKTLPQWSASALAILWCSVSMEPSSLQMPASTKRLSRGDHHLVHLSSIAMRPCRGCDLPVDATSSASCEMKAFAADSTSLLNLSASCTWTWPASFTMRSC